MVVIYTETNRRYSERDAQCECDIWEGTDTSYDGTNGRAALIRFEGGGFRRSDKSLIETQFEFFTNETDGLYDDDDDIVVFSCNYPQQTVNQETAIGSDTEVFLASDNRYTSNPSFMDAWLLCAQDAISFVIENAAEWNVDPNKIIVSGASAGGFIAGGLAYARSRAFSQRADALWTRPHPEIGDTGNVAMLVGNIIPFDLSEGDQTNDSVYAAATGILSDSSAGATNLEERSRRVSATHLMEVSGGKRPLVFSHYNGQTFDPTSSSPLGPHDPMWGVRHHNRLQEFTDAGDPQTHALYVEAETSPGDLATATNNNTWAAITGATWPMTEFKTFLRDNNLLNTP